MMLFEVWRSDNIIPWILKKILWKTIVEKSQKYINYAAWQRLYTIASHCLFGSHQLFVFISIATILVSELFLQDSIVSVFPFFYETVSNSAMGLECQLSFYSFKNSLYEYFNNFLL